MHAKCKSAPFTLEGCWAPSSRVESRLAPAHPSFPSPQPARIVRPNAEVPWLVTPWLSNAARGATWIATEIAILLTRFEARDQWRRGGGRGRGFFLFRGPSPAHVLPRRRPRVLPLPPQPRLSKAKALPRRRPGARSPLLATDAARALAGSGTRPSLESAGSGAHPHSAPAATRWMAAMAWRLYQPCPSPLP